MHIAIVGAGALGTVYALHLAEVAQVTFVVRDRARAPQRLRGERPNTPLPPLEREAPPATLAVPDDCDVVLVTVHVEQLDDGLLAALSRGGPPDRIVVVLAPLLPPRFARAHAVLGDRLVAAMPGVVAWQPEAREPRTVRYWLPRAAPTLLDEPTNELRRTKVSELVEVMRRAGVGCDVSAKVRATNAATTIAFFPILTGIAAAGGSIDRMLVDDELLDLGLAATKQAKALAKRVGDLPGWAGLFLGFANKFTVRTGIKLGRSKSPESIQFLESHFGTKLRAQNEALLRDLRVLAEEHGVAIDAIERLAARAA